MERVGIKRVPGGAADHVGHTAPAATRQKPRPQAARQTSRSDAVSEMTAENPATSGNAQSWDLSRISIHPPAHDPAQPPAHTIQPHRSRRQPLPIGSVSDPLEAAADRAVTNPSKGQIRSSTPQAERHPAPPVVHEALNSTGQPLESSSRAVFEKRFQHDFSSVQVHSDTVAGRAAQAVGARAFTVADHIVLGHGGSEQSLMTHELAHVVQQSAAPAPWVQRQPVNAAAAAPRKDYVFLMGEDQKGTTNPFFTYAAKYFHAHLPAAAFIDDQRSLSDLLKWIVANVSAPIGNLYIVSHGNEDGTLFFGLNSPTQGHMSVPQLREELHPSAGGTSSLPSVAGKIDAQTTIHIKGCDIGRTHEMVELIDEAFGGAGTVTAPTHEQRYSTDPELGSRAEKAAHDTQMATFQAGLPPLPAQPAAVDPKLKGDARKEAKKTYDAAVTARKTAQAARTAAIAGEEKRIKPDLEAIEKTAETVDSLSGPLFQRPGTTLYTAAELQPEIDRLYGHLSAAQRKSLAQRLVAPNHGGPGDQQGQKVDRITPVSQQCLEPETMAEAKAAFGKDWAQLNFEPKTMTPKKTPIADGSELEITFTGIQHQKGSEPTDYTWTSGASTIPSDQSLIDQGKANTNDPDHYQWRVDRKHDKAGMTTLTATGERVQAYLHHGTLDAGPHDHFSKPESNADFYATSTFTPPPPSAPSNP